MATKKTATTTKKSVKKPATAAKKTTTKVTTVKSASARAASAKRFSFSRSPLLAASVAEFIGTFLLAGVIIATSGQPLFVLFGLAAIIIAVGAVSGAHLNPALTIGALATKRVNATRAVSYIVAQVLGAMLALVVLNGFISAAPAVSQQAAAFGQSAPSLFTAAEIPAGKEWVVLAAELLGTTIFAFAFAAANRLRNNVVGTALGVAGGLYVAILVAGTAAQYVGASAVMNPAVAGSLQALSWSLWPLMVYVLTPLVGGVLGFALNDLVDSEAKVNA